MRTEKILIFALAVLLSSAMGFASSIEVSQAGADSGTVMKGSYFTVTVSGLSSSGSVSLALPSGFSTTESTTKSYGEGTTSVSWTTVIADQKLTGQTISATITIAGSPETVETSSFDVVLPPSFVASATPSSFSGSSLNSTYYANVTFTVQNWGETTAKDVVASMTPPAGMSFVSGYSSAQTIGTINGGPGGSGESKGVSWRLQASDSSSGNINITLTSSNTDTSTTQVSVSLSFISTTTTTTGENGTSGGPQGGGTTTTLPKKTQFWNNMSKGSSYVVKDFDKDIGFKQINITVSNNANNVRITITKLAGQPASITKTITGNVYKFINVDLINLGENNISNAKIQFHVEKWWVTLNKIDRSKIYLYRYHGGNWEKLNTTNISEDATYINYESSTPGFSTFAIAGETLVAGATTTTTGGSTGTTVLAGNETATTTTVSGGFGIFSGNGENIGYEFMLIIMFLIGAGGLFYIKKDALMARIEKIRSRKKKDYHSHIHPEKKHEEKEHHEKKHEEKK